MSKWIKFIDITEFNKKTKKFPKTKTFLIRSIDPTVIPALGFIKWYGAWRKYVFFSSEETIFESTCLQDIIAFIKQLMDERKVKKK